jgi:hypothetical protein
MPRTSVFLLRRARPALLLLAGSSPHRGHNAFMLVIQSDPSIEISLMLMVS